MPLITLVALQPMTREGQHLIAGDVFSVRPIEAAALTYRRQARFATPRDLPRREPATEPAPAPVAPPTPQPPPTPPDEEPASVPKPKRSRRSYRRRDMTAED